MADFAGQVSLVTGGSRGVGRAVCLDLARRGSDVALFYLSQTGLADAACEGIRALGRRALALQVDVANPRSVEEAVARVVAELGPIDVLVHSAGAPTAWAPVRELGVEDWSRYIDVDLKGAFHSIQAVLRHMHERGSGVIIAISSIAAQMCQSRNAQGAAAKAGMEALVRVVAREEGRHGIRANVVSIGLTDTDQTATAFERWGPEASRKVVAGIPLGRIARPEEIAEVVAFLAGQEGGYITGKVIQVDGGQIIAG